jgi:hypothetical protein
MVWGSESGLRGLFGDAICQIEAARRHFAFRYASPEHFLDVFRRFYGPTHKAFLALDEAGQSALADDVLDLLRRHNRDGARSLIVAGEYLEAVVTR